MRIGVRLWAGIRVGSRLLGYRGTMGRGCALLAWKHLFQAWGEHPSRWPSLGFLKPTPDVLKWGPGIFGAKDSGCCGNCSC